MRIVIATTSAFHLRHLARELIAMGRDVTYMSYLPKFRIRRDEIPLAHARSYFLRLQPWSSAALFRRLPSLQQRAVEAMFARTDEAFARDLPPCDVFIGLSAMAVESARVARRKYGAKVILERGSRHVSSQVELLSAGGQRSSAVYVARELAGYEIADCIALPSTHAVESFLERGFDPARLFRNPYGVDFASFAPSPRPDGPLRLLFVGSWSYEKGCDALAAVIRADPKLTLTHVGTRGDLAFPALANFTSLGHKTHPELRAVMARHHILLLPSRQDGFGMVLAEALASGLPVIGSAMTGAPDLKAAIGDKEAVTVVEPANADALAGAIRDVAEFVRRRPADRRVLTEDDRVNLSWAAYARRYDAFLRTIA
ncbi:MAG: glycosyltransferase family 4 protein [Roseiarcus sp.]|jgi:glycosyltransferase involved in cell wall biosynthesis